MTNKLTFERISAWLLGLMLLFCACFAHAQVVVSPIQGLGTFQLFDNNGETATSGVLYSYQAGTSTQQATYTDSTGTVLNPNPIPFGSGARVNIWLVSADFYKFVGCLQNDGASCAPADVLFSVDNVPGNPAGSSGGSPFTGIFISSTINPATSGILRLATADTICWRNSASTANLCISKNTNDALSWAGAFAATSFASNCTPTALTGAFELCDTDTINWRNHANSADVALSKDTSDNLNWPNGFNVGTNLSAATLGLSGIFTSTSSTVIGVGPEVSTPGSAPAAATQDWYLRAGKGLCTLDSSSNEYCTVSHSGVVNPAVLASSITNLSGDVSVSASTVTTVLTKAVTMPSSGCPCRVFVSYEAGAQTTNPLGVEMWINDGTSNFATGGMNTTGSVSSPTQFHITAGSYSPTTYANSAAITFTWKVEAEASMTVKQTSQFSPQGAWLNVAVVTSN